MDEIKLTIATRLGRINTPEALLRCGGIERPWLRERRFVTPQYALCWVATGSGTYRDAGGRVWRFEPGCVLQRFPDAPHDIDCPGHSRWWFIAVPAPAFEALRQIGLPTLASPVFMVGRDQSIAARFASLTRRLRDAPDLELAGCFAAMIQLIIDLHLGAARARDADLHAAKVDAACRAIAADPSARHRPTALARQVGMGYHAFRKAFARRAGCGVAAWALRRRLQLAQELLADRTLGIAEVAMRVGYRDPLQFSAIFRRHVGAAPSRWRRGI
jgi:AraC-like DNA-binding protein